jgi:hypothetical protein
LFSNSFAYGDLSCETFFSREAAKSTKKNRLETRQSFRPLREKSFFQKIPNFPVA